VSPIIRARDPAFVADPYPLYDELRATGRVVPDPGGGRVLVAHHADVLAVLRDRRSGRIDPEAGPPPASQEPFWRLVRAGMLDLDPPHHTRLRRLVAGAFTPRAVRSLEPVVRAEAERRVARVAGAGTFDLVAEVAEPLPVAVIGELLGIPPTDRGLLRPWSAAMTRMFELEPTEADVRGAVEAARDFSGYVRGLLRERRRRPGRDLLTALAGSARRGRLTEDEAVGTAVLLLNAGHEATVNATSLGWWTLFRHPDQLARLRAEPRLVDRAIEELLRYDTPLQYFERFALTEVELAGVTLPRGTRLGLLFGSANRDPAAFPEPDRLDLARQPNPHLGFGAGIHACLGAPLARLELRISFQVILRDLPPLEPVGDPAWKPGYVIRGLRELRVSPAGR
jgi:cytochrome P450